MKPIRNSLVCSAASFVLVATALAQSSVTVTPMKGQSADQVARDQSECAAAATSASGYDPNTAKPAVGGRAKGATKGAALGAAGAEVRGHSQGGEAYDRANDEAKQDYRQENAKDAAKVGAVAGGAKQRRGRREDATSASAWDTSYRGCLSGRGYSVK